MKLKLTKKACYCLGGALLICCITGGCLWGYQVYTRHILAEQTAQSMGPFSLSERQILFDLVRQTIRTGLAGQQPNYPDVNTYPPQWREKRGVYVTLNLGNKLLGFQGTKRPQLPFVHAVVDAAYRAAFANGHFTHVTQEQLKNPDFNININILGTLKDLDFNNEKDLIHQMRPFNEGMTLTYKRKQSLFLPSMWKKYPTARDFLKGLKRKAKMGKNKNFRIQVFSSESLRDIPFLMRQDKERINGATQAFARLVRPDGSVIYNINFKEEGFDDKNNIVREMGSGYGLAFAYHALQDKELQPKVQQFLQYAKKKTVSVGQGGFIQYDNKIKSGATALALLGALYYEKASGDKTFVKLAERWKNGLLNLYTPKKGIATAPNNHKMSPYYEGESWLALAVFRQMHPEDKKVAHILGELTPLMMQKYGDKYRYNFFHWGMQAAAIEYQTTHDEKIYQFIKKQFEMYDAAVNVKPSSANCAYAEGLGAGALVVKEKDHKLYLRLVTRLDNELEALRVLIDLPQQELKKGKINEDKKDLVGLFLGRPGNFKTRNDTTQHCLSAFIRAQDVYQAFLMGQ